MAEKHGGPGPEEEGIVRHVLFQRLVLVDGDEDDEVGNDVLRGETAEREREEDVL